MNTFCIWSEWWINRAFETERISHFTIASTIGMNSTEKRREKNGTKPNELAHSNLCFWELFNLIFTCFCSNVFVSTIALIRRQNKRLNAEKKNAARNSCAILMKLLFGAETFFFFIFACFTIYEWQNSVPLQNAGRRGKKNKPKFSCAAVVNVWICANSACIISVVRFLRFIYYFSSYSRFFFRYCFGYGIVR